MPLQDFQEKKKVHRLIYSWPTLVILATLITWSLARTVSLWKSRQDLEKSLTTAHEKILKTKETKSAIENRLRSLESSHGLDLEARGRFNLKKQGEEVVIFLDEENTNQKNTSVFNTLKFASILKWLEKKLSF